MLTGLSGWIDKAVEELGDESATDLLSNRLAPDMFPLATQIRFACVQALEGTSRASGHPMPPLIETLIAQGQNAATEPGTLVDAKQHLIETLDLVSETTENSDGLAPETRIQLDVPGGLVFKMRLDEYARDWAVPQFYFHVNTAYAILRGAGVNLGKADYVAHMFAYQQT